MRLDQFLTEAAVGSRKVVREYVKMGKVSVNENLILEPATIIDELKDLVYYEGKKVEHTGKVYFMFHKPAGCVTARSDVDKKTVMDYFSEEDGKSIFPVGRLDMDTEGLLFLTNDGEFNHKLMHPNKHVEKKYFFWAMGSLSENDIEKIETGIQIEKEGELTKPSKIEILEAGTYEQVKSKLLVEEWIPQKYRRNIARQNFIAGYLVISEGRKHQVKRMLKAVGCYVIYLKREAIGAIELDKNLLPGQYRQMTENEIKKFY